MVKCSSSSAQWTADLELRKARFSHKKRCFRGGETLLKFRAEPVVLELLELAEGDGQRVGLFANMRTT